MAKSILKDIHSLPSTHLHTYTHTHTHTYTHTHIHTRTRTYNFKLMPMVESVPKERSWARKQQLVYALSLSHTHTHQHILHIQIDCNGRVSPEKKEAAVDMERQKVLVDNLQLHSPQVPQP